MFYAGVQIQQPGNQPEGVTVSEDSDVASDPRYGTTCLFLALGFLLYFDKSIRSVV